MPKLLTLLVVCLQPCLLLAGAQGERKYINHGFAFSMSLPKLPAEAAVILETAPIHSDHGFRIDLVERGERSIGVFAVYNASYEENTEGAFLDWLREGPYKDLRVSSHGRVECHGLAGFRAILVQSAEDGREVMVEVIRVYREARGESPGIWYEFSLKSDKKHYVDDSSLFSALVSSFEPTRSKFLE